MDEIAQRLLQLYKDSGYSYPELERITGISKSTLQRYFTGETAKIPLNRLEVLAKAFDSTPAYIMGWTNDPEPKPRPNGNGDLNEIRERLRRQPGMRILFDASKGATEQDLKDAAALIEGFKKRRDGEE